MNLSSRFQLTYSIARFLCDRITQSLGDWPKYRSKKRRGRRAVRRSCAERVVRRRYIESATLDWALIDRVVSWTNHVVIAGRCVDQTSVDCPWWSSTVPGYRAPAMWRADKPNFSISGSLDTSRRCYPRESFREGLCNHRRWFVCLFVTTITK